jgi:hypothetical protein
MRLQLAAIRVEIGSLDGLQRHHPALALEDHPVALGGVVGGEQVVGDDPGLIGDLRLQGVGDIDVGAENAEVAEIAVVAFVVGIEARERTAGREIQPELAVAERGAAGAPLAAMSEAQRVRRLRAVEGAAAVTAPMIPDNSTCFTRVRDGE